ncbi:MAG: DUF554 domain-containing protein [Planctomycetes bacterium]|nr:DUF554 domain-containing protein [Planctomycetota bacterium]
MWHVLNGTVINVATVVVGSVIGLSVSAKLPERYRLIVLNSLGLITIMLGVDAAVLRLDDIVKQFAPLVGTGRTYGARVAMVMIGALLLGAIAGTALRLHERIEALGGWIHGRFSGQDGRMFAEGFLTASVIFCVGPLTLVGCLQNGAHGDPSFLYIKALLDGFCSIALASTFGWGVFASVLTVGIFQGGLALLAFAIAKPLDELSIALMTTVGGVVLLATGLMILEIKRLPVADLLPGIFLPPLIVWLVEWISPGVLLPLP